MSALPPAEFSRRDELRDYGPGDLEPVPVVEDVSTPAEGVLEHAGLTALPYNTVPYKSYEDYDEIADDAYALASEYEKAYGLTKETGTMYWEAAQRRADATWMAGKDQLKSMNAIDRLRIAGSLAIAVETGAVPDYHEPQYDETGQLIDRRANIQRIYSEMMVEAGRQISSEDNLVELVLKGESEAIKPSEVMTSAIHEGGKAAGDEKSAAELEEQITQEHETPEADTETPILAPAVAAEVSRIAVEGLTGAHKIPVAHGADEAMPIAA